MPSPLARHWALDPEVTFLNHGSYGACPTEVLAVQREWRDRLERQPVKFLSRELDGHLAEVRDAVGAFVGADPDDLGLIANATGGVNAVVRSLRFEPGDEILTTDHEYNAILNVARHVAARDGARVVVARLPFPAVSEDDTVDRFLAAATDRTRLVTWLITASRVRSVATARIRSTMSSSETAGNGSRATTTRAPSRAAT